jgi:hypothetical protein
MWRGRCASCFLPKTWLQGIFCSNFAWTVGDFPACQRVWCGECYTSSPLVSFHIRTVTDEQDRNDHDPFHQARLQRAWKGKHRAKDDFLVGRNGDHTLLSFECDLCIIRKLKGRDPDPDSNRDDLCQAAVRRVNLDAMWARSKHTVQGQRDMLKQSLRYSQLAGLEAPYWYEGPLPDHDHCGYEVAIQMVLKSRAPAKHSQNYTQFDTIRKLRSVYEHFLRSSPQANRQVMALGDEKGRYQRFSTDPCGSLWFHRFITGCRHRMGMDWRPNEAMSLDLILAVLNQVEDCISDAPTSREKNRWTVFHSFSVVAYVISLRGTEGFLLDIDGLRRHRQPIDSDHVIIALLGKIKGEHHDRAHLVPCVPKTGSGIDAQRSLERLIDLKEGQGFKDRPVISDAMSLANCTRQETSMIASKKFLKIFMQLSTSSFRAISSTGK